MSAITLANTVERAPPRIGFLFNHEHLHQIAHSAPIAFELARTLPPPSVTLFAGEGAPIEYLRGLAQSASAEGSEWHALQLNPAITPLRRLLDAVLPFSRIAILFAHRAAFRKLDVLVVPEKTSLLLRSLFGLKHLKFVHTRHGAGDREIGFDRASGRFDLVLMSGPKIRDRLLDAGLLRQNGHAIVGYPKFDLHGHGPRPKLFDNDRPTIVYNPHCSPRLSSWYRHGHEILEYFYRSTRYNLIFAPHVMLFRKRVQVALDRLRIHRPGRIPQRYLNCPHMLIDTGSARSVDMTYTRAADLYLGDASSQIYEFLLEPRPCVFFDAHETVWLNDVNYGHWQAGPVINRIGELDAVLAQAFAGHTDFRERQRAMFAYSFDLTDTPSAQRGADAILKFIAGIERVRAAS